MNQISWSVRSFDQVIKKIKFFPQIFFGKIINIFIKFLLFSLFIDKFVWPELSFGKNNWLENVLQLQINRKQDQGSKAPLCKDLCTAFTIVGNSAIIEQFDWGLSAGFDFYQ